MSGALSRLYRGETRIDFIGKRKIWLSISAGLVLISLVALFVRPTETPCRALPTKGLNCGIEFNGGLSITAPIPDDGPLGDTDDIDVVPAVEEAAGGAGASQARAQVSTSDEERRVLVQTTQATDEEERQAIIRAVADAVGVSPSETASESISASFGSEITSKAIRALVVFLVVIAIFISVRFEWKMALSAIAALIHDLIITAGVYAIVGFEVTPSTVIAILTILGYSLYDTVVVFDKVEENTTQLAATGRMTYEDAANLATNQVFMRSLNTSLASLLPVMALLFVGSGLLGASTLGDLALALFVGLFCGAYSSVFFATPILSILKEREPKYRNVRAKVLRDAERAAAKEEAAPVPAPVGGRESEVPEKTAASGTRAGPAASSSRPSTKPRAGSKKAKRRRKR